MKYEEASKEQLIEELHHRDKVINGLTQLTGQLQTQNVSTGALLETVEEKMKKMEQQMMDHIAKDSSKKTDK